jgi:hypothetical protein
MSFFDYVYGDRTRTEHPRSADESGLYTFICDRCRNPFVTRMRKSGKPRDSIEYEPLRKKLMIQDPSYEPVFCDSCFIDTLSWNTERETRMSDGMQGSSRPLVIRTQKIPE